MTIPGLDRKAMEAERLARVANAAKNRQKREREVSPPSLPRTRQKLDTATLASFSGIASEDQKSRKPENPNKTIESTATKPSSISSIPSVQSKHITSTISALLYPRGVVKKTWAFGQERDGHDIKLEEVLEPSSVRTAVLSAFQWDTEWVLSKLKTPMNGGSTKCIFVMQAKSDEERNRYLKWAKGSEAWMRICLPPMKGLIWCMHSKLMLLFHLDKLRIAIPTANLLNFDWGETGQMENSVFLIDLPRLEKSGKAQTVNDLTSFGQELAFFVEKQAIPEDVRSGLLNFDFRATANMAFVHTVGGINNPHQGAHRTGLLGLSRAVRSLGLAADDLEIDFAASSIGRLNNKQLEDFYSACSGQALTAEAAGASPPSDGKEICKKRTHRAAVRHFNVQDRLRIYFPTRQTVQASIAGAAGTICLQRKYFEATNFPRAIFRDYKSKRHGLLSHNKILLARSAGKRLAWAYVGSANMSASAWGEVAADRTRDKITCRNWECGVLLPVAKTDSRPGRRSEEEEENETESEGDGDGDGGDGGLAPVGIVETDVGPDVFGGLVDVPFEMPGERYNGREPWYFTEQH